MAQKKVKRMGAKAATATKRAAAAKVSGAATALKEPDWAWVAETPVHRVRACLFYMLNMDPKHGRRLGISDEDSTHPLAERFEWLLTRTARAMIARNPLLQPLLGNVTADRDEVQQVFVSLDYFIALIKSDLTPYPGFEVPKSLLEIKPAFSFMKPSAEEILTELPARERLPRPKKGHALAVNQPVDTQDGEFLWNGQTRDTHARLVKYMMTTMGGLLMYLEQISKKPAELSELMKKDGTIEFEETARVIQSALLATIESDEKRTQAKKLFKIDTLRKRIADARAHARDVRYV